MTALFSFVGVLTMLCLAVCTFTYIHMHWAALLDRSRTGVTGLAWKSARLGERASPWVALACVALGVVFLVGRS